MDALIPWGLEIIRAFQSMGNSTVDAFFKAVTFLGDEKFYLLVLPLLYWSINKGIGVRLGFLYLYSSYISTVLKNVFAIARPSPSVVEVKVEAEGYAFPSGHAQTTATVWGYLATQFRRRWFWLVTALAIVLVGLSRIYLGVHYPQDVIGGIAIAILLIVAYNWGVQAYSARIAAWPLIAKLTLVTVLPILLFILRPEKDSAAAMGAGWGLGIGIVLDAEYLRFRSDGAVGKRVIRFLAGMVVTLLIYFGLSAVLGSALYLRALRYGLIGLWVSFGAPWFFIRLGLANTL
ncbi:MAG: phosphatase PAP2 family protein [Chloroflexi bacterium]|nr:phosphatase PAP2 family protein [Chloroflexota bacterium]